MLVIRIFPFRTANQKAAKKSGASKPGNSGRKQIPRSLLLRSLVTAAENPPRSLLLQSLAMESKSLPKRFRGFPRRLPMSQREASAKSDNGVKKLTKRVSAVSKRIANVNRGSSLFTGDADVPCRRANQMTLALRGLLIVRSNWGGLRKWSSPREYLVAVWNIVDRLFLYK